jgi:hypothetical protein
MQARDKSGMSVAITIMVICSARRWGLRLGAYRPFGTSFITKGSGFKAADIDDRDADKPRRHDEDAAFRSHDST